MSIRSRLGDVRRGVLSSLHKRTVPLAGNGPIITFSFDDFPRTAVSAGARILEDFGIKGTYYTSMSLMNTTNALGEQFRRDDLEFLLERGHEIASHTYGHLSARQSRCDEFIQDVRKGEQTIVDVFGVQPSGNFAYPRGDVTLETKRRLGQKQLSCRGTTRGLNGPSVDLNLLKANSLYGDVDSADKARRLIHENENERAWLIFYSHDVCVRPSTWGCTPKLLEAACSLAVRSRARIMTVAEVMTALRQPVADQEIGDASEETRKQFV